jgi:dipeptidyl aminopeptidase/acylaminoacyl peptidase
MFGRLAVLLGIALIIVWLCAGAVFCEMSMRTHRASAPSPGSGKGSSVAIRAHDGSVLRGTFIRAGQAANCVVVLHGITDSSEGALGFSSMFLDAGYSVLAPDSRAHGFSEGTLVTFGLLEATDLLGWAAWLQKQGCTRLFGLGESLGASTLIQAAARKPVFAAIVSECSFRDLPSIAEYRLVRAAGGPQWLGRILAKAVVASGLVYARVRYGLDLQAASPVQSAKRLRTPLLLIHGLNDLNTPPSHSRAIAEANPAAATWFVPAAGHTGASSQEPAMFRRRVLDWFQKSQRE